MLEHGPDEPTCADCGRPFFDCLDNPKRRDPKETMYDGPDEYGRYPDEQGTGLTEYSDPE